MFRGAKLAGVLAASLLLTPAFAQRGGVRHPGHPQVPKKSVGAEAAPQKHAGDWLRRYKDLPPDQQRAALEKDPQFQKLPPQRQQQLLQRLQRFSSLPPQQQNRILNRMETFEHLTPDQKKQVRNLFQEIRDLPPGRRKMLAGDIRNMRSMTPEQREQWIQSDQTKAKYSDHERDLLSTASRLPLAPVEEERPESPDE
jgi:hypothetical protein